MADDRIYRDTIPFLSEGAAMRACMNAGIDLLYLIETKAVQTIRDKSALYVEEIALNRILRGQEKHQLERNTELANASLGIPQAVPPTSHRHSRWPFFVGSVLVGFLLAIAIAFALAHFGREDAEQYWEHAVGPYVPRNELAASPAFALEDFRAYIQDFFGWQ